MSWHKMARKWHENGTNGSCSSWRQNIAKDGFILLKLLQRQQEAEKK